MAYNQDSRVKVRELISSASSVYVVQDLLGRGAYGEVTLCRKLATNETVAVKILKNRCIKEAKKEVQHLPCVIKKKTHCIHIKSLSNISYVPQEDILKKMKQLNSDKFNIVRWNDSFTSAGRFCLEFEKLDISLSEFLQWRHSHCLSLTEIRPVVQQVCFCNTNCIIGSKTMDVDAWILVFSKSQLQLL